MTVAGGLLLALSICASGYLGFALFKAARF